MSSNVMDYVAASAIDITDEVADLLRTSAPYVGALAAHGGFQEWDSDRRLLTDYSNPRVIGDKLEDAWDRTGTLPPFSDVHRARSMVNAALDGDRASMSEISSLLVCLVTILKPTGRMRRDAYIVAARNELLEFVRPTAPLLAGAIRRIIRSEEQLPSISGLIAAIAAERSSLEAAGRRLEHVMSLWCDALQVLMVAGYNCEVRGPVLTLPPRPGPSGDADDGDLWSDEPCRASAPDKVTTYPHRADAVAVG